jgi:hypothetical protein
MRQWAVGSGQWAVGSGQWDRGAIHDDNSPTNDFFSVVSEARGRVRRIAQPSQLIGFRKTWYAQS